jgi:hypothetical protein
LNNPGLGIREGKTKKLVVDRRRESVYLTRKEAVLAAVATYGAPFSHFRLYALRRRAPDQPPVNEAAYVLTRRAFSE